MKHVLIYARALRTSSKRFNVQVDVCLTSLCSCEAALPWEALREAMTRALASRGKTSRADPLPWDVCMCP